LLHGYPIKVAGSKEAFRKADLEYPLQIAIEAQKQGAQQYLLISAMGANKDSMVFYNKVKGELEEQLQTLHYAGLHIFHPSMLDGPRIENRIGEKIGQAIMRALNFIIPQNYKLIHVEKVAKAMILQALKNQAGLHIIPSGEMQSVLP
jgi:uncharacterized protein YbjT (DUF2867 family)